MKNKNKLICLLLSIFLLQSIFVFSACGETFAQTASPGDYGGNLAAVYAFADCKIQLRNAVFESGSADATALTDFNYSSVDLTGKNDGWVKIKSFDGTTDFKVTVTIDLGFVAKDLSLFHLRAYRAVSKGINTPKSIDFYVSQNETDFVRLGTPKTLTSANASTTAVTYSLQKDENISGRYIKVIFNCNGSSTLYLNEIGIGAKGTVFRGNFKPDQIITDNQGVIYKIQNGQAKVIGLSLSETEKSGTLKPSDANFNLNKTQYTLGNGSDNEVEVFTDFIGADRVNYSASLNNIKYIVIHNTATIAEETDAIRYNKRMHTTTEESSWHYTVDNNLIYHSLSDNIAGWHAGSDYNYQSIGIEMCVNGAPADGNGKFVFSGSAYDNWVNNRFRDTMKNTAVLTAELLTRYGLGIDAVVQHYDSTEKNCPQWLRHKNGKFVYNGTLWEEFMGYVEKYYKLLNGENPKNKITPTGKITLPDYISLQNGDVFPVTEISAGAFAEKGNFIQSIQIGKMVTTIPKNAFESSDIGKITVEPSNGNFTVNEEGMLVSKDGIIVYNPEDSLPSAVPNPKKDSSLDIREQEGRHYLFTNSFRLTLEEIQNEYGTSIKNAFSAEGAQLDTNDVPSTGAIIRFSDEAKLYVVSHGDVDGNGKINAMDYVLVKRICFKTYAPQNHQVFAAAISNGKTVTSRDYILIKRHCFGTYDINSIYNK